MKLQHITKIFFCLTIFFAVQSCERRSCENVVCASNQQCLNGNCYCTDGYEGANCLTESRQQYVGNYNVTESCYSASPNFPGYTCSISAFSSTINYIEINNLFNQGTAGAIVHTDPGTGLGTSVEVPYQNIGGISLQATGTFDPYNNRMTLNFNYTYNGGSYQCTHTFYKF